ncbi:MAG: DUF6434 domain-containing protein [Rickettsiales bacterium]
MSLLPAKQLKELETCLNFFKMEELKELKDKYSIKASGKKGEVIKGILAFFSGDTVAAKAIPKASIAKPEDNLSLNSEALILKNLYKNNDETREFMKQLAGEDFHFTAAGQDWIKNRWMEGNPPTYKEFAEFWKGYKVSKKEKPKDEWAYLNFIQQQSKLNSKLSMNKIKAKWAKHRMEQVNKAKEIIRKYAV